MADQAPNIEPGKGKLVYDKARRTIVAASPVTPTGEALVAERDRYRHALANIIARYGATPARHKNDYEAGVLAEAEQMSMIAEEALRQHGPEEADQSHAPEALRTRIAELETALRGALKLPRPWIDGGTTYPEWAEAFDKIEAALAAGH